MLKVPKYKLSCSKDFQFWIYADTNYITYKAACKQQAFKVQSLEDPIQEQTYSDSKYFKTQSKNQ